MIRRVSLAGALVPTCLMMLWGQAAAATSTSTVGQLFAPDNSFMCGPDDTLIQFQVSSGNPYTVSSAGTITSWSFQLGSATIPGLELKVARPLGAGGYLFVGQWAASAPGAQTPNAVNTFPADINVQPGDIIGVHAKTGGSVPCGVSAQATDRYGDFPGDPSTGFAEDPAGTGMNARIPVAATVTTTIPDQPAPSNAASLGKPLLNTKNGTATEPVFVPGPGLVTLTGKGVVTQRPARASASRAVGAAGIVNLLVKSKGKTKKKLNSAGKAKVKVTVTFTPTGGSPNAQTKTIKLKKNLR